MKRHTFFATGFWILVLGGWIASVAGQELKQQAEQSDQMAVMEKYATPNEHHQQLARRVGTWQAEGTFWMEPGSDPVRSLGTMTNRMVLGGRFLQSEYEATFMEKPFSGFGLEGYDVAQQKHIGMWVDSMGTMMMTSEGQCQQDGKILTTYSNFKDPVSGQDLTMKTVTTEVDGAKHIMEAWMGPQEEKMFKTMEIVYTRK